MPGKLLSKTPKAHIYVCKADLPGQREEEARVWSDDGSVLDKESQEQRETQQNKIVPRHHLEHSTSNSLSIQALSHDLAGSDR